ncbi:RNA helicase [Perkinsela sp. CCAP 1560/4]|nr:RNA helicase [Perkinsela sp. CCAP 1560/4]|eukprot:KNH08541.1 RNA helicase [Perkinsela sp. CCAP 1560/4]
MVNLFDSITKHISFEKSTEARNYEAGSSPASGAPVHHASEASLDDIPIVDCLDFFGSSQCDDEKSTPQIVKSSLPTDANAHASRAPKRSAQSTSPENPISSDDYRQKHDIHATVLFAGDCDMKKKLKSRKARKRMHDGGASSVLSVPPCVPEFSALKQSGVPSTIIRNLARRDMTACTAVQAQAIPALLASLFNESLPMASLVCAPTGSGKTIAYLVPLSTFVVHMKEKNRSSEASTENAQGDALSALVVVPTRELAMQIERELLFLTDHLGIHCMRREKSKSQVAKQDILVSTPKRVLSLLDAGHIAPRHFRFCVFDEFDRLFDRESLEMHKQTLRILESIPKPRAIIGLFSATIPQKLEESFRKSYTMSYYRILVGGRVSPTSAVVQKLQYVRDEASKTDALRRLITAGFRAPMLIFVHTADRCEQFARGIETPSLRVAVLKSDMPENAKNLLLEQFRLGEIFILITTDLLARGMDFKDVGTVVNADIPLTAENYVHRIGRCGRAGGQGTAVTFFTDDDRVFVPAIVRMICSGGGDVEPYLRELKVPGAGKLKRARIALGKRHDLPV